MKRTKSIDLRFMRKAGVPGVPTKLAAAMASALAVSGCGDSQSANVYGSVEDCKAENPGQEQSCQVAYQDAQSEAVRTAPRYSSQSDCEQEFGPANCQRAPGTSWFIPAMAGFMLGNVLSSGSGSYMTNRSGHWASTPVFTSKSRNSDLYGGYYGADGSRYGSYGQTRTSVSSDAFSPKPTQTRTISRGGFGSMASARSSWGGSSSRSSSGSWGG